MNVPGLVRVTKNQWVAPSQIAAIETIEKPRSSDARIILNSGEHIVIQGFTAWHVIEDIAERVQRANERSQGE